MDLGFSVFGVPLALDGGTLLFPLSYIFGDILTDLAGAIVGGIGLAASGNINPERAFPSMFEPVHGSAPDIAGTGKANPLAAVLCATMLLAHIGENEGAQTMGQALESYLAESGAKRPVELGGSALCTEVGDAVVKKIG